MGDLVWKDKELLRMILYTEKHAHTHAHTHKVQAEHGGAHLQPALGRQKQVDHHKFQAYGLFREFQTS